MANKKDFKFFVIGVGLPRTGTNSTKAALEILLPGKCMHMFEVHKDIDRNLNELFNDDINDKDFRIFFVKYNYVAGTDLPFILKYQQAMRVFPDALVLLTVREPEGWVRSMKNTICESERVHLRFPYVIYHWIFPSLRRITSYLYSDATFMEIIDSINRGQGLEFYNKYVEEIKATVPSERLLVFNVKEGWKPLCEALKLPVPKQPFPNVNDSKEFQNSTITRRKIICWGLFIASIITPPLIGYGLKRNLELFY